MKFKFNKLLFTVLALLLTVNTFAQQKTVTGTIKDTEGTPLIGATVMIKGTSTGTDTDFDGNYSIKAEEGQTLVFSYIGYKNKEVVVTSSKIDVVLLEDTSVLDEIVVTGYGTQTRATLTNSVSKIETKAVEVSTKSNAAQLLQGTPGIRVINTTGQPGATPSIVIRGGTAFNGSGSPLILIDGIPGNFYALNADDIESIDVLKDANAAAIYGARAANGVVIVTTKTGKSGKSSITYRQKYSVNKKRVDQKFIGAEDFINYNRQSIGYLREIWGWNAFGAFLSGNNSAATGGNTTNSPYTTQLLTGSNSYLLDQPGWSSIPDILNPNQEILFYDNTEVADRIFTNSYSKDHYLAFDGGNDRGTYYLGLGFLDNDGLVLGSGFKRYSGKFSGSYKINNNISIRSNLLYSHSRLGRSGLGGDSTIFRRFRGQAPTSRTYDNNADGTWSDVYAVGTNQGFGNPLYYHDKFIYKNLEQRLQASVTFDWKLFENFKVSVTGSHFTVNNHNETFNKAYRVGSTTGALRDQRIATFSLGRTLRNQLTALGTYTKKFGKHNVNAMVGFEYFHNNGFNTSAGSRGLPTDIIETANVGTEANGIPSSFESEYKLISQLGRVLYDFDNKYLFNFTIRRDGSSRLGNNKFDVFPSASVGWNMHQEDFIQNTGLSNLFTKIKPRYSYGSTGNQGVLGNYTVYGTYSNQGIYNGQTGYGNSALPNLDLLWEKAFTSNFGLDVGMFDNRLSFLLDIYNATVKNKLAGFQLPSYTGFSSVTTNNGSLSNRGVELQVNGDVIRTEDFTLNFGASISSNRRYVEELPENDNDLNRQGGYEIYDPATGDTKWVGGLQEGQRVGTDVVVAFIQEDIYDDQAAADADSHIEDIYNRNAFNKYAGDVKWKDVNNDGIINHLDREVIGRVTPNFTGNFNTTFKYKNFSLFLRTDFAGGHIIWNEIRNKGYQQTQGNLNQPELILESWTPDNTDADWPRMVFVDAGRNIRRAGGHYSGTNNKFWEKGDYLAIRELSLSYEVPTEFLKAIKRMNVYVTGTNLHYFKSYTGESPEQGGVQWGTFPMPRTYTFGLNITF